LVRFSPLLLFVRSILPSKCRKRHIPLSSVAYCFTVLGPTIVYMNALWSCLRPTPTAQELFLKPRYVKFSVNKICGKKRQRTENGKLRTGL
jgi:hypothetical protein